MHLNSVLNSPPPAVQIGTLQKWGGDLESWYLVSHTIGELGSFPGDTSKLLRESCRFMCVTDLVWRPYRAACYLTSGHQQETWIDVASAVVEHVVAMPLWAASAAKDLNLVRMKDLARLSKGRNLDNWVKGGTACYQAASCIQQAINAYSLLRAGELDCSTVAWLGQTSLRLTCTLARDHLPEHIGTALAVASLAFGVALTVYDAYGEAVQQNKSYGKVTKRLRKMLKHQKAGKKRKAKKARKRLKKAAKNYHKAYLGGRSVQPSLSLIGTCF